MRRIVSTFLVYIGVLFAKSQVFYLRGLVHMPSAKRSVHRRIWLCSFDGCCHRVLPLSTTPLSMWQRCVIGRMLLNVAGAARWDSTEQENFAWLKPLHHGGVAFTKAAFGIWIFLRADRGNSHCAAFWLTIETPIVAIRIAPTDGWNDRHAFLLPVRAELVLAPVVVDLHGL